MARTGPTQSGKNDPAMWDRIMEVLIDREISGNAMSKLVGCGSEVFNVPARKKAGANMTSWNLKRFCEITGVSADYILGLSEPPRREIEQKVIRLDGKYRIPYECPECGDAVEPVYFIGDFKKMISYCSTCGQKLDWSEE